MKMSTLSPANFRKDNILLEEHIRTINNKIKLHILGVPINKLENWLISLICTHRPMHTYSTCRCCTY